MPHDIAPFHPNPSDPGGAYHGSAVAKEQLDDWLDDRNFDAMGRQRVRLAARPPAPPPEKE